MHKKTVHVCSYIRFRLRRWEKVIAHRRSAPKR